MPEYIERDELMGIEKLLDTGIIRSSKTASYLYDQMLHDIQNIPAADVEPVKHGRWIGEKVDIDGSTAQECSECHKIRIVDNYCSNCGARMCL